MDGEIDPRRVARYVRWSTDEQTLGTTREVQLELIDAYCLRQGWPPNPTLLFVDEGQSGGSLERPALERLRRMIAAGSIDCVVVARLDRLARSLLDAGILVMREWEGRAELRSATEQFDLLSPFGRQAFYTQIGYAELERAMIRERTLSGKRQRAVHGQNPGVRPPYGYRLGARGQPWLVVPHEAAVVRRIFDEYLSGHGLVLIRDGLNAEGIAAPRGGLWASGSLYVVLQNPVYAGVLVYGRTQRRGRGAEPTPIPAMFAPALVAAETFHAVQRVRRAKGVGQAGRAYTGRSLLTGVLRCRCGAGVVRRSGGGAPSYGCAARHDRGTAACAARMAPQAAVDGAVVERLLARYGAAVAQRPAAPPGPGTDPAADRQAVLRHCRAERTALHGQLRRVQLDYRCGAIDAAQWQEVRTAVQADLTRLALREQAARRAPPPLPLPVARHPTDLWSTLTQAQRKVILRSLIVALTLWRDPLTGDVTLALTWADRASPPISS